MRMASHNAIWEKVTLSPVGASAVHRPPSNHHLHPHDKEHRPAAAGEALRPEIAASQPLRDLQPNDIALS